MSRRRTSSLSDIESVASISDPGDISEVNISTSIVTDLSISRKRRNLVWYHHVGDFFNCLKAFIGTNYQALPFAFHNSGLALGLIGVLIIAVATDHCVQLLVKCKNIIIDRVCRDQLEDGEIHPEEQAMLRQRLQTTMGYGDIGSKSLGPWCFHLIQFAVWFTQFMTAMSYYIFIGNTVYAMFPVVPVPYIIHNASYINGTVIVAEPRRGHGVPMLHMSNIEPTSRLNIANDLDTMEGKYRVSHFLRNLTDGSIKVKRQVDGAGVVRFTEGYYDERVSSIQVDAFTHVGLSTIYAQSAAEVDSSTNLLMVTKSQPKGEIETSNSSTAPTTPTSPSTTQPTVTEDTNVTVTTHPVTSTPRTLPPASTVTPASYMRSTAPDLRLIILFPLPFFIATSMIRKVRYVAPFSSIATVALFGGAVSVLVFIIANFRISDFAWYKFYTLPLFLGQLISAYEGIGCVIPIQSSMDGNRHLFPAFLHGAVTIVFFILCSFGVLGYLTYGEDVEQIIVLNIPQHSVLAMVVDVTLIISVLFTYPLQCFPVIDILEIYIFGKGSCCRRRRSPAYSGLQTAGSGDDDDQSQLMHESSVEASAAEVSVFIPAAVPAWKRNTLRLLLTLSCVGLAILLKDAYAYTASVTGAIGASLLAFILPCLIHLNLQWHSLSLFGKVKDIFIIVCAVTASMLTLVSIAMLMLKAYRHDDL